jgi:hypothetical protein
MLLPIDIKIARIDIKIDIDKPLPTGEYNYKYEDKAGMITTYYGHSRSAQAWERLYQKDVSEIHNKEPGTPNSGIITRYECELKPVQTDCINKKWFKKLPSKVQDIYKTFIADYCTEFASAAETAEYLTPGKAEFLEKIAKLVNVGMIFVSTEYIETLKKPEREYFQTHINKI